MTHTLQLAYTVVHAVSVFDNRWPIIAPHRSDGATVGLASRARSGQVALLPKRLPKRGGRVAAHTSARFVLAHIHLLSLFNSIRGE